MIERDQEVELTESEVEQIVGQIRSACDLSAAFIKNMGYTLKYTITKND
jgi:hypothetical protein